MSYFEPAGDIASSITSAVKSGVDFYSKSQVDAGAAGLARAQAAQPPADSGLPIMPIVLLSGAGLIAWMLLKKKKA